MATTEEFRNGGATTFTSLQIEYRTDFPSDIKVRIDGGSPLTYVASNPSSGQYTVSGTTVTLGAAAGAGTENVHIYRETNLETAAATFVAGSSVRAADLNACHDMVRLASQEQNQAVQTFDIQDKAITSTKILDGTIVDADINASAAIAGTKVNPAFGSQNMSLTGNITVSGTVDGRDISTDGSKLDGIEVGATANQDASEIRTLVGSANDSNVFTDTLLSKLNAIEPSATQDQTASEIKTLYESNASTNEFSDTHKNFLNDITATATELNVLDGISVTTNELNNTYGIAGNIQSQLNNKQPLDAELTELATMSSGTASALADLTQAEVQTLDGITATTTELNLNDGQTATPTEVNILDGATVTTNELNILDGVTATKDELNLLDGKSIVTSISGSATDVQIPSAQAVNERITTVVSDVGGFVPITNETSFPVDNPDLDNAAGTIVSIKALNSAFTTGSGVTTHTISNGAGSGKNVTITGLTQSTTYPAGRGLILETTQYSGGGRGGVSTEYEYAFHRLTLDETGVADAQAAIDDFDERYYGPFSSTRNTRPSGANRVNGDLYFNTSDGKMKVFNGSHASGTWDDVAAPGNFFINTLSSSSGSGGGSATFNGTATRFTLSNPPLTAQQLLVSVNGVIQKPNSGTSPSEGFAISGADIIFASAPAASAPYFIVTIGSSVNIGTPSDGTVTSAKIVDGTVVNGDISSSAAIARTKLANVDLVDDTSPQLGGDLYSNGNNIKINDSDYLQLGTDQDLWLYHAGNSSYIAERGAGNLTISTNGGRIDFAKLMYDGSATEMMIQANTDGAVSLYHDGVKKFETTSGGAEVTGNFGINSGSIFINNDSQKLYIGAGQDLEIQHDGTNNIFKATTASEIQLNYNAENMARFIPNGSCDLYYDNSRKFQTTANGVTITGNQNFADNGYAYFGAGNDMGLYSDGSGGFIKSDDLTIGSFTGGEKYIDATLNGAVDLYHDNTLAFQTNASGATVVDGDNTVALGLLTSNGQSGYLVGLSNDTVLIQSGTGETMAGFNKDGSADLYYNGSKKFETTSTGTTTSGSMIVDGDIDPYSNNNNDLGSSANRWRALHVNDGIYFGGNNTTATQLDDYEEGQFTPIIQGTGSNNSKVYVTQLGEYTKIGHMVWVRFRVAWSSRTTDSGSAAIYGLPYNCNDAVAVGGALAYKTITFGGTSTSKPKDQTLETIESQNGLLILTSEDGENFGNVAASIVWTSSGEVRGSAFYTTNS